MTNKQIAQTLGIEEDTVKKHLQHVYDKLAVRRRALVMIAVPEHSSAATPSVE
jgi:DNA-binding NarL/FixJ family response regulator